MIRKVLPVEIHTVNYDDMLRSAEATGKELFNFIGITWQPECIEASCSTHSVKAKQGVQLRQDKYKSPARHWRHYRKYAHAMVQELVLFNATDASNKAVNAR